MAKLLYDDVYNTAYSIALENKLDTENIIINQNSNGRYCVEINYKHAPEMGVTIYFPNDVSSTSTISSYISGGTPKMADSALAFESVNTGNAITIYPRKDDYSYDSSNKLVVDSISKIEENLGINTTEYVTVGFSAGDYGCRDISIELIKRNPSAYHNITYVDPKVDNLVDMDTGAGSNLSKMSKEDALLFKRENVHISTFTNETVYRHNAYDNDRWLKNYYNPFKDNNNFMLVTDGTIGDHGGYRNRILEAGVMNGGFDWIENIKSNHSDLDVKTRYLNPTSNNSNLYNDFYNKVSEAASKKNSAASIRDSSLVSAALGTGLYSALESNLQLIEKYTSDFAYTILGAGIFNRDVDKSIDSSGMKTFENVKNVYNKFVTYSKGLYNKMFKANNNILKIGQSIDKMDSDLKAMISDDSTSNLNYFDFGNLGTGSEFINDSRFGDSNIYKVRFSDLENAISDDSPVNSMLLQDIIDTKRIKYSLESMIDGFKDRLKGDAWKVVLDKLYAFDELLTKKYNYSMELNTNIKKSYRILMDYMNKYNLDEIDSSKTKELEEKLVLLKAEQLSVDETLNNLRATHGKPIYDVDNSGRSFITGYVDNSNAITSCELELKNLERLILVLETTLEGYYGFPNIDYEAANIIGYDFNSNVFENSSLDKISSVNID